MTKSSKPYLCYINTANYFSVYLRFKSLSLFRQSDILKPATSHLTKEFVFSNFRVPFIVSNFVNGISYFMNEIILDGN